MYDVTIIGGGFYGCMIALFFRQQKKKVLIVEKEHDIMLRASFNNQARVHNGYHYPRALMTAESSHKNYDRFTKDFFMAIKGDFLMTYAIAKGSKTNAKDFVDLYERIGSPLSRVTDEVKNLLNWKLIEDAFTVEERVFDGNILRELVRKRLYDQQVYIRFEAEVLKVEEGQVLLTNGSVINSKRIINCAYAGINDLLERSDLDKLPTINEDTSMPLVKVPKEFQKLGITIMDGDFFAVMPFPPFNLHTIHHVKFTPEGGKKDSEILKDSARFIPCLSKAEYIGSIREKKAILLQNATDDGRPTLYKKNYGFYGFDIVLGSKLDTVYDIIEKLRDDSVSGLNVV